MYRSNQSQNISLVIIVINVVVFFLTYMAPGLYEFLAIYPDGLFNRRFIWTPVTYMFVHGGITHIIFNMIFLLIVGPSVERSMGQKDFVAYYFVCGALAGLFSVVAYLNSGRNIPIVGASGAIYAVMLAFATYYPGARFFFWGIFPIRAPVLVLIYLVMNIYSHVFGGAGRVANLTHLSGFAFGFLYLIIRMRINPVKAMRGLH